MPELEDHDVPKDPTRAADPRDDALMSNPELREAYNRLREYGLSHDDAHLEARRELFGDEYVEEEYLGTYEEARRKLAPDSLGDADYAEVEDALTEAVKSSVFWVEDAYDEGAHISKAPGVWRESDDVPEAVRDLIADVIDTTHWDWDSFESLPIEDIRDLEALIETRLTQPQGWSIESLARDIEQEFHLTEDAAVGIAADTSHNVLNTAKEEAYDTMEGSEEFEFDWLNPNDHRTTPVCQEIQEEINDRGGSVTKPVLKQILMAKAEKYEGTSEGGGTPDRVQFWEPHYQCRSTFARVDAQV